MDKQTEVDWAAFSKALEKEFSNDLMHCNDQYELLFIKKQLKKDLPDLTEGRIDFILDECCKLLPAPRTITDFTACIKKFVS